MGNFEFSQKHMVWGVLMHRGKEHLHNSFQEQVKDPDFTAEKSFLSRDFEPLTVVYKMYVLGFLGNRLGIWFSLAAGSRPRIKSQCRLYGTSIGLDKLKFSA